MKNREKAKKYLKNKYYNKDENYKAILSEIRKDENMNKNKIFKTIVTTILTLLGATTIAFAGTQVYNNYIKEKNSIQSISIFDNGTGTISYETDLTQNDMILNSSCTLHHKIITNMEDYNKYKERIAELPEMSEEKFEKNFLVVVANILGRQPHEKDLELYEITADETTTHIIIKQKENPDYSNKNNVWYAVVDKAVLREKSETSIEYTYIENPNFIKLSKIPSNYTIEDAIKDGCFVENKNKVVSSNIYAIDEFIKKAEKKENAFIRIYSKSDESSTIEDIEYKDGIFISNIKNLKDNTIKVYSFNYMEKGNKNKNNLVRYYFKEADDEKNKKWFKGIPIVTIYQE